MGAAEKLESPDMPPWEQHAGVINMPRFLYSASSLMHRTTHTGFLITCPFRREKSATKEALELLRKYVQVSQRAVTSLERSEHVHQDAVGEGQAEPGLSGRVASGAPALLPTEEVVPQSKRVKLSATETVGCHGVGGDSCGHVMLEGGKDHMNISDGDRRIPEKPGSQTEAADIPGSSSISVDLVPVKLCKMGIIFITAPTLQSSSVVLVVSRLLNDVQAGVSTPPKWCHRILPVQATCPLERGPLHMAVREHLKQLSTEEHIARNGPLKFAVAYNRRGVDEERSSATEELSMDKSQCITAVSEAVLEVYPNVTVDLTRPDVVIVVEALPLSGSKPCVVCAVSIVPGTLVDTKPRLCMKPLIHSKKK